MQKKIIIFLSIVALFGLFVLSFNKEEEVKTESNEQESLSKEVEKVEVVHFHATRQCWSCIKVGELALKTIKEEFPDDYKEGKIVFLSIDVELPENKEIVERYQARMGSSLFVNKIIDGEDNIKEDIRVWRLIYNNNLFTDYFKGVLDVF